jgi:branched-chain amino acid transport system permease protein
MLLGAAAVVTMLFASKGLWGVVQTRFGFDLFSTRRLPPRQN